MRPSFALPGRPAAATTAALLAALMAIPGPALATAPTPIHQNFSESYDDVVCGIPVHVTSEGQWTNTDFFDRDGNFVLWRGTYTLFETLTASSGTSVIVRQSNQLTVPDGLVDPETGTVTYVNTIRGVSRQVRLPGGRVVMLDVGYLSWALTLDLETGDFVSVELRSVYGPHPDLDSDFTLFCEVIDEALG